jgi:hypothetical protein
MHSQVILLALPIALTLVVQGMHWGLPLFTTLAAVGPQSQYPSLLQVREPGLQVQAVAFFLLFVNVPAVPHLKHVYPSPKVTWVVGQAD